MTAFAIKASESGSAPLRLDNLRSTCQQWHRLQNTPWSWSKGKTIKGATEATMDGHTACRSGPCDHPRDQAHDGAKRQQSSSGGSINFRKLPAYRKWTIFSIRTLYSISQPLLIIAVWIWKVSIRQGSPILTWRNVYFRRADRSHHSRNVHESHHKTPPTNGQTLTKKNIYKYDI